MSDRELPKRPRGRPRSASSDGSGATVQALDRGLTLLTALARQDKVTLSDLAFQVGLPPSTAHRLLMTLNKHGMATFDEASQRWMVGLETFRVGSAFLRRTNLVEASQNAMQRLMEETQETANLAIPDGTDVVFVSQVETHNPIRAFFRPGTRTPMHASGIGKALLASMPRRDVERLLQRAGLAAFTEKTVSTPEALFRDMADTAVRGWSFDDEERYLGMRCVASVVYGPSGQAVAGLSVSGPTVRMPDGLVPEIGSKVRRLAAEITDATGGRLPD
ncbi:HTH-type transcriptional regulator BhcR [Algicella marina]|uniref:Helix-turn-helix domain-containing protein n=1 Tax=Algicella marina TaxID=2683284 RepID=A0A6P1T6N3_9RHOB|nr:HTH-type transcriptional regulator BhcR [Algicella marina]QHQ36929.1 helix-turn-helix domain-containing protein [Algicella marina]